MTIAVPNAGADQEDVELGLPDGPLDAAEQDDCFTTKIGGKPCWLRPCPQTEQDLACRQCRAPLYLLLQMDCPLPQGRQLDRIICIFACNSRECTESGRDGVVRVIVQCRRAILETKPAAKLVSAPVGLWDRLMTGNEEQEVTEQVEALSLSGSASTGVLSTQYPVQFPPLALHIVDELIAPQNLRPRATGDALPDAMMPAGAGGEEGWQMEEYEKMTVAGYDKVFRAFHSRVAHYPRQCVRYSPHGSPLLFSNDPPPPPVPACSSCGRPRHFDLQLMPAILGLLPKDQDHHLTHIPKARRGQHPLYADGMEWGTILVYTCGACNLNNNSAPGEFVQFEGAAIVQVERE